VRALSKESFHKKVTKLMYKNKLKFMTSEKKKK